MLWLFDSCDSYENCDTESQDYKTMIISIKLQFLNLIYSKKKFLAILFLAKSSITAELLTLAFSPTLEPGKDEKLVVNILISSSHYLHLRT